MKKIYVLIGIACLLSFSCKEKKQTLGDRKEDTVKLEERYATEETLDTIIPHAGIKFKESRRADPQHPPVVIDLQTEAEKNELDVNRFYTKAGYVKLKHPLAEKGIGFLGNARFEYSYEGGGMSSGRGFNSSVFLSGDKIVAGDSFFGYHCYDRQGNYSYTIVAKRDLPRYDRNNNRVFITWNAATDQIYSFSMLEDNCLTVKLMDGQALFHFHNIALRKNYLTRPASFGLPMLLSPDTYVGFMYNAYIPHRYSMMHSFDIKGDTLCRFMNYNSLPTSDKGMGTNPETSDFYYYNDRLTMRQAYNDTIYRVSVNRLTPAFIFNTGSKKPDVQTALRGNKEGKIFINTILETDDFLFTIHTENYDSPNNRKNGSVKFFYSYYDKKSQKRYSIPSAVFPEVFTLKNSVPGAIPVLAENMRVYQDKLYVSYTKIRLKEMIDSPGFASFPATQQEKLKELYDDLADSELLIMILQ